MSTKKLTDHIDHVIFDINIIDRNILDVEGEQYYPTDKQTGIELLELVSNASRNTGEVCLYAYNTVFDYDKKYIPNGISSRVDIDFAMIDGVETYNSSSGEPFKLMANTIGMSVRVDGVNWPIYDEEHILVPNGKHMIEIIPSDAGVFNKIVHFTGDIQLASRNGNDIIIQYEDQGCVYTVLDKLPASIILDDMAVDLDYIYNDGNFTIKLPAGLHKVEFIGLSNVLGVEIINKTRKLEFEGIRNDGGVVMVSAVDLLTAIGSEHTYNSEYKTISANINGHYIWMAQNNPVGLVNSNPLTLSKAPYYMDTVLYIPLKETALALGFDVIWDEENKLIQLR